MPRTTDPAARRRQLAQAAVQVIATHGLEAATMARIAATADATTGLIQQHFRNKDELLMVSFDHLIGQILQRLTTVEATAPVGTQMLQALSTLLPLDAQRRTEGRVWLAIAARAQTHPPLAQLQAAGIATVRDRCADAIRLAQQRGQAAEGLDAEQEGRMLAAFVDGLWLHMMSDPDAVDARQGHAALAAYLQRLFIFPATGRTGATPSARAPHPATSSSDQDA